MRNPVQLAIGLVIVLVVLRLGLFAQNGVIQPTSGDGRWVVVDWLINYSGGFVRRGLTGEIFLRLSELTGIEPQYFVYAAYALFAGAMLVFMALLFGGIPNPAPALALVFAPYMMSFDALTQGAGGRKDIILLSIVAALAWFYARYGHKRSQSAVALALCAMPLVVLSHEAWVLFLPYVLVFAFLSPTTPRQSLTLIGLACLSLVAFAFAYTHRGDAAIVPKICHSLGVAIPSYPDLESVCTTEGAVVVLSHEPADELQVLANDYLATMAPMLPLALILTGLAFLPMAPFCKALARARPDMTRTLIVFSVVALLLASPLFVVAVDWGRWIRLHAAASGLVLIAVMSRAQRDSMPGTLETPSVLDNRTYPALVFAYATCWSLAHVGQLVRGGLLGDVTNAAISAILK